MPQQHPYCEGMPRLIDPRDRNHVFIMKSHPKIPASLFSIALGGWLAVWLPWFLAGAKKNMIDGMRLESLALLVGLGVVASWRLPQRFWSLGLAAVAAFPVWAISDAFFFGGGHSLFGLELAVYGLLALPVWAGAAAQRTFQSVSNKGH